MAHARDGASRLPAEHLKAGGVGWILDTEKTIAIVVKASPQETAPETLALPQRRHAGDHAIAGLGLPHQVGDLGRGIAFRLHQHNVIANRRIEASRQGDIRPKAPR